MSNPIKSTYFKRIISVLIICFFFITSLNLPLAQAQDFRLPAPGVMVHLSPPLDPPILKGIKVHPNNPFHFDFILDKGDSELSNDQLKVESSKLIKYFLASLTVPEKDLWVNLSPYEKDRIIPNSFGLTEMGRDLLAEDYMLKQITASLIYPEDEIGKKFWKRIYEEAAKRYGTTNIPVNTFNKVWIVPEKALVFENAKVGTAYVVQSKLKVMLEQDYLSLEKHEDSSAPLQGNTNQLGSQIVREIVIPELTKEVNEDKNFVQLRQVYNSLILATWYKMKIKDSILSQVYSDKNKVAGVNIDDPKEKEKIYQQYLKAFKKGVYNYIKEEYDPVTQETIPRKYFSGGVQLSDLAMNTNSVMQYTTQEPNNLDNAMQVTADMAMTGPEVRAEETKKKIAEALRTLNGITDNVEIAQAAGVHVNTVKRHIKELLQQENDRRRQNGIPILGLRGDLTEVIQEKLATFPGGELTRVNLAGLLGVTDETIARYSWRDLVQAENVQRTKNGKTLIQISVEAVKNPRVDIAKALREMDGFVTIDTISQKAKMGTATVGKYYRGLVEEENDRRKKEEPERSLLLLKASPMTDVRKAIQDALMEMEGEVSNIDLQQRAGLKSHVPLIDYKWREMVEEENVRRKQEELGRPLLTAKAPNVSSEEVKIRAIEELKSWPGGPFLLQRLIEKLDSNDTILRKIGYKELVEAENKAREAKGAKPEELLILPKEATKDPEAEIQKALRTMEGRIKIPELRKVSGLSAGSILRYDYKNLIREENERRKKEEPARFLIAVDDETTLEAINYALPKIEGKQTGAQLAALLGFSKPILDSHNIGQLIRKENERRQKEEPGHPLIGWRYLASNPLESIKEALRKLEGVVTVRLIAYTADLSPETVRTREYKNLIEEENQRRQKDEKGRSLLSVGEEALPRGEGAPRIIQALRQMEGKITAKMIAKEAGVSEGTVYLNKFRSLAVQENIRRVQEEPNRPLLELPQAEETDDELKIKAKFLDDVIEKYNLEDVISGTVEDVEVMMDILMLLDIKLPPSVLEALTVYAYRGLKGQPVDRVSPQDFHGYQGTTDVVEIEKYVDETDAPSIVLEGRVQGGFRQIQILGDRNKTIDVGEDGRFRTRIILVKGREIRLRIFGFDDERKLRTKEQEITIKQTSMEITPEDVLANLLYQKEEVRRTVESKPEILKYVISRLELGLLHYFTEDEEEGMRQIALRIQRAKESKNLLMERIYTSIQEKFERIKDLKIDDFREKDDLGHPQRMYFYQKYVYEEVHERILRQESGDQEALPGVIIALEQGLGKTPLALALMRDYPQGALAVVPNSVAVSWGETESKFFHEQKTNIIAHGSHQSRVQFLRDSKFPINVVTFEFLRSDTYDRFNVMNRNKHQLLFIDESQMLGYEESLQSQGANRLAHSFTVLLSGTPIVSVGAVRSVIQFLEKDNIGLKDARIFSELFNKNDPDSLRLLHFMIKKYTLRIKARHVFKEYDRNIPLGEQNDRLPAKVDISADQRGAFTLAPSQERSIEELFTDWNGWVRHQKEYGLKTEQDNELQKVQQDDSYFSKLHALLQIMTFVDYSDRNVREENPKVKALDEIVHHEVDTLGSKIVISAKYNEEIERYVRRYRDMGYEVATFYGETDKEFKTKAGYIADEHGHVQNFRKKNMHEFIIGPDGRPVVTDTVDELSESNPIVGPMTPKDYNRLVFQNDPKIKILVTNDATGGVGVNFTAASATIRTNRGRDVVMEDQFDKRINRIDNQRKKYETRHYVLQAKYSAAFLDRMKTIAEWRNKETGEVRVIPVAGITTVMRKNQNNIFETLYDKYFVQGTYDQVQDRVFKSDRIVLDVILGGFQTQGNLDDIDMERMLIKFPNLRNGGNIDHAMSIDLNAIGSKNDKAMLSEQEMQQLAQQISDKGYNDGSFGWELLGQFALAWQFGDPTIRAEVKNNKGFADQHANIWRHLKPLEDRIGPDRQNWMREQQDDFWEVFGKIKDYVEQKEIAARVYWQIRDSSILDKVSALDMFVRQQEKGVYDDLNAALIQGYFDDAVQGHQKSWASGLDDEQQKNFRIKVFNIVKERLVEDQAMKTTTVDVSEAQENRTVHNMTKIRDNSQLGGIDLTPANMNLKTENGGGEIKFHLDQAMLQQLQSASGFVPVIINIQPMTNLKLFLELADD